MPILCVGSPHGNDQVGWLVGHLLRDRGMELVHVIRSVDQLMTLLSSDCRSIIVDACQSGAPVGTIFRFEWPDPRIAAARGLSSHAIDVPYALRMAEVLGKLPRKVILFAIEVESSHPAQEVERTVIAAAHKLADQIEEEIASNGESLQCMNDL